MAINADKLLSSNDGKRIMSERDKIEKLGESRDGKAVMELAQRENLAEALEKGDTEKVRSTVNAVLNTESGRRLMEELSRLLGK